MSETRNWDCEVARRAIHERLDGETASAEDTHRLAEHLRLCSACREADAELQSLQAGLRSLPAPHFPDDALREVLGRTIRAERQRRLRSWGVDWRLAAAAAITLAVVGLWSVVDRSTRGPSEEELVRAAAETRAVLGLAARALRSAERAATHDVLASEISPALRRVPIAWPSAPDQPGGGRPAL